MRLTGLRIKPGYEVCYPRDSASRPSRHSPVSVCSPLLSLPLLRDRVAGVCRPDCRPVAAASPVV